ncbi:MAG: cupredoxin domain-containing protein [Pleurocapsa sp. MO_226.B13]|nr:cupredoxin domain-containing protein [Pleurocapsa sp. MO_226.B13]
MKSAILNSIKLIGLLIVIFGSISLTTSPVLAAPSPKTLNISLGNSAGELKFFPDNLQFQAGQQYKLVLDNPSPEKHYFTAKDFADASWSRKVEAGKVEVKGAIHELELKPGAIAEWVLTPMKPGKYELHCSIKGHAEAGMIGEISIED